MWLRGSSKYDRSELSSMPQNKINGSFKYCTFKAILRIDSHFFVFSVSSSIISFRHKEKDFADEKKNGQLSKLKKCGGFTHSEGRVSRFEIFLVVMVAMSVD